MRRERFPDLGQQREPIPGEAFAAAHEDLPRTPLDVVEFQRDDLAGPQPKTGEQQQNGVIAPAHRRLEITGLEHALDLLWAEIFRNARQSPVGQAGHRRGEVSVNGATLQQEPADRAQGRPHALRVPGTHRVRMTDQKRRDRRHVKRAQVQRAVAEPVRQKPPQHPDVLRYRDWREPAFGSQILLVVPLDLAQRRLVDDRGW
jgi:hypothetical protein